MNFLVLLRQTEKEPWKQACVHGSPAVLSTRGKAADLSIELLEHSDAADECLEILIVEAP